MNYAKSSLTACLKILPSDPRNRYPKLKSPSAQHLLSTGTTGWSHCCQANACEEEVKTRKTPPRKGQELPVLLFHRELHGGGRPSAAELEPHSRYVRTRILAFLLTETCWFCLRVIWSISWWQSETKNNDSYSTVHSIVKKGSISVQLIQHDRPKTLH